ncbi:protein crumbs homolog 3b [Epinephelus moara]|uniref:protein crumbs homolog 3b n=1 Tax=Epinephelus moara TaxID=300413 RepID=UPI00214F4DB5|nr:protein crumbs homolog 3b [Epinephelus moara]
MHRQVSVRENSFSYAAYTPSPGRIKTFVALLQHLALNQESPRGTSAAISPVRSLTGRCPTVISIQLMLCWSRCKNTGLAIFSVLRKLSVTMAMQVLIHPTVSVFVLTVLSVLSLAVLLLLCLIRKKRRMEGTYRPSAEEKKQTGSAGSEKPGLPLPLPKEERLI